MNRLLVISAVCASVTTAFSQTFNNETVNAADDIYSAGNAGNPDGNQVSAYNLGPNPGILTFSSVTGDITLNSYGGMNNPDGVVYTGSYNGGTIGSGGGYSDNLSYGRLSGITEPGGGGLVGVFESATSLLNPAPASLNYYVSGDSALTYSPLLDQVFLIGDGLTGNGTGSVQQFIVPTGATKLFLGISDAYGFSGSYYHVSPGAYGDNFGNFTASFQVSSSVPDDSSSIGLSALALAALMLAGFCWKNRHVSIRVW